MAVGAFQAALGVDVPGVGQIAFARQVKAGLVDLLSRITWPVVAVCGLFRHTSSVNGAEPSCTTP